MISRWKDRDYASRAPLEEIKKKAVSYATGTSLSAKKEVVSVKLSSAYRQSSFQKGNQTGCTQSSMLKSMNMLWPIIQHETR